jgi:hypothetical protein
MMVEMNKTFCKKCKAELKPVQGITTQAFCMCCHRAHGGPLCGDCKRQGDLNAKNK